MSLANETNSGASPSPFTRLPLEIKGLIVKLVDEQDKRYRERLEEADWNDEAVGAGPTDSDRYGAGIRQLALCNHEIGALAAEVLYSVSLPS